MFPEPGRYKIGGDFGEEGPKYTIGITHPVKEGDNFPSPGAYDTNTDLKYHRTPLGCINPEGMPHAP